MFAHHGDWSKMDKPQNDNYSQSPTLKITFSRCLTSDQPFYLGCKQSFQIAPQNFKYSNHHPSPYTAAQPVC